MKKKRSVTVRLGPLALSLLAAGITAVGFAAVSLAANGGGGGGGATTQSALPAPPPGAGVTVMRAGPRLSAEDQKKMEEFQQCMQDNGAPGPPKLDPNSGPPKPPSPADQQQIQKAFQACKDKLPQDMQNAGPPHIGVCGPPPGAPPAQSQGSGQSSGTNKDQSNQSSGSTSSGSTS